MKKSQFFASVSRKAGWGAILSALRPTWVLSLAGQTSTHKVQPVQSSGATCTVYAKPCENSLNFEGMCLKVSGAFCNQFLIIHFVADDRMRTNHHAFTALNTQVCFPDGDFQRDIALFPLGCAERDMCRQQARRRRGDYRRRSRDHRSKHIADEFRRFIRDRQPARHLGA